MNTTQYLDAIRTRYNLKSDFALAKFWGTSRQKISQYRTGYTGFSDDNAVKVAKLLDMDPGQVLANIHAAKTKNPELKKIWQRLARAL